MKITPATPLNVLLAFAPAHTIPVGRLALDRTRAASALEYGPAFLASGLTINPRWPTPGRELVWAAEPRLFDGLHGVFADSLPDAWGRELMRRRAIASGMNPSALTALDRLAIVGHRGMGALIYEPAVPHIDLSDGIDLDQLSHEAFDLLAGIESDAPTTTLEQLGESSGGARPKILVAIDADGNLRPGVDAMPAGYRAWIVKFRAPRDRADVGPLEAAYADMARAAGIDVTPTTLLSSGRGGFGYFATQRFDRGENGERLHALSVAGLLETPWELPAIDYSGLMSATRVVTRNQADVERVFRRMVFNVIAHNRDDHAKQHAFLMDRTGTWRLAPAYDLNFSSGPGGEHFLPVNGRGNDIGFADVRAVAKRQSINAKAAAAIVDEVRSAVTEFRRFAERYDVPSRSRAEIASVIDRHVAGFASRTTTGGAAPKARSVTSPEGDTFRSSSLGPRDL